MMWYHQYDSQTYFLKYSPFFLAKYEDNISNNPKTLLFSSTNQLHCCMTLSSQNRIIVNSWNIRIFNLFVFWRKFYYKNHLYITRWVLIVLFVIQQNVRVINIQEVLYIKKLECNADLSVLETISTFSNCCNTYLKILFVYAEHI